MKKFFSLFAAAAVWATSVSVSAACNIKVSGNCSGVDCGTSAYNDCGSTMVPFRGICEAIGANVLWNGETRTASANCGNKSVSFCVGGNTLCTNFGNVSLAVPSCIKNDSTFVPLRALCEALGCRVDWNPENGDITIVPENTGESTPGQEQKPNTSAPSGGSSGNISSSAGSSGISSGGTSSSHPSAGGSSSAENTAPNSGSSNETQAPSEEDKTAETDNTTVSTPSSTDENVADTEKTDNTNDCNTNCGEQADCPQNNSSSCTGNTAENESCTDKNNSCGNTSGGSSVTVITGGNSVNSSIKDILNNIFTNKTPSCDKDNSCSVAPEKTPENKEQDKTPSDDKNSETAEQENTQNPGQNQDNKKDEAEKPQSPASAGDYQAEVLKLVNEERAKYGLSALSYSTKLEAVAYAHSKDMADNNFFNHTNLSGKSPFDRIKAAGITYRVAAENIAAGQKTPADVVNAWMNSAGHRANILNSSVKEMGLGVYKGGSYGIYWTQLFIG